MRWLCNENIPRNLVEELRRRGHDVVWIRETSPGIADAEVLAIAVRERRICLTFDKDFGELAAAAALPADCGVLLLRVQPQLDCSSARSRYPQGIGLRAGICWQNASSPVEITWQECDRIFAGFADFVL